jgi:hypothetical protein
MNVPSIHSLSLAEIRTASINMLAAVKAQKATGVPIPEEVWSEYASVCDPHTMLLLITLVEHSIKSGAISVTPLPSGLPN